MKIYNGYKRLARDYSLMTDEYEFSMINGYLNENKENQKAVFDVFFRRVPQDGGYAVMAGLDKVIEYIQNLKFSDRKIECIKSKKYSEKMVKYMTDFKFSGNIYAIPDGTPVFPNEPILTVEAPICEAQLMETVILCLINGSMEHATSARRIVESTPDDVNIMEFGLRRADGTEAGIDASICALMAGCKGTSNTFAADMLNIPALGTIAHSWIESFDTEIEAFMAYSKISPNNCIILVDTYDTLKSGVPNAIKTFEYMKSTGMPLDKMGIRIDSGDLAYLSKEARSMLDESGFPQATICLSNGLDAKTIESLVQQKACFNSLGVGDNISKPDGRMGCVYKEVALEVNNEYIPKIKISNDVIKTINPDFKKLYRAYDKKTGYAIADIMTRKNEQIKKENLIIVDPTNYLKNSEINDFDLVELQKPIFINGELVYDDPDIFEKRDYCNKQMNTIYPEVKRNINPHTYYVDGTKDYVEFKNNLIKQTKEKILKK